MLYLRKMLLSCAVITLLVVVFTSVAFAAGSQTGTVNASDVRLRSGAGTSYKILGSVGKGEKVSVLGSSSSWDKVRTARGSTGWMSSKYITIAKSNVSTSSSAGEPGLVNASDVRLRSGAGTSYKTLGSLGKGEKVSVIGSSSGWDKVRTASGSVGWVFGKYISMRNSNASRGSAGLTVGSRDSSSLADQVISYAKTLLGTPYVYGGTSPSGFDCSGLVQYVYKNFGISLNRVAADQATQGIKVSKSDLQPGDLVFFDTSGGHSYVTHAGIYIGNGQFIQASSGSYNGHKVVISDISQEYYAKAFMVARRVL